MQYFPKFWKVPRFFGKFQDFLEREPGNEFRLQDKANYRITNITYTFKTYDFGTEFT